MAETQSDTVWLTQDAFDKLQSELEHLVNEGRAEVSAKIAAARDEGDLKENGGYHAAREEQGQQESRIAQLKDILQRAQVGETPKSADKVAPGLLITVTFNDDPDDSETFVLGSREILDADPDITVYSPQSPLGSAIINHKVNDKVSYETPNGKTLSVTITKIQPYHG